MRLLMRVCRRVAVNPWILLLVALSYGAGVLTMLPFGLRVSAEVASLISAGIGAVAGVGGALCVVLVTDFLQGRNIAAYVHATYRAVFFQLGVVKGFIAGLDTGVTGRNWKAEHWPEVLKQAQVALSSIHTAHARLLRVEPNIHRLKAYALDLMNEMADEANNARIALEAIQAHGDAGAVLYGGELDGRTRQALDEASRQLLEYLEEICREYALTYRKE